MNTLGTKMNMKVLNLFLRIFLSHSDSVVIIIRLDHLYTRALAADWMEGGLWAVALAVEVTDISDCASGSRLEFGYTCSGIMNEWREGR